MLFRRFRFLLLCVCFKITQQQHVLCGECELARSPTTMGWYFGSRGRGTGRLGATLLTMPRQFPMTACLLSSALHLFNFITAWYISVVLFRRSLHFTGDRAVKPSTTFFILWILAVRENAPLSEILLVALSRKKSALSDIIVNKLFPFCALIFLDQASWGCNRGGLR